jgi:hypothetical protein
MIKSALTLPKNEDTFWFDTAIALIEGKKAEILAEKGNKEEEEDDGK